LKFGRGRTNKNNIICIEEKVALGLGPGTAGIRKRIWGGLIKERFKVIYKYAKEDRTKGAALFDTHSRGERIKDG